LSKLLKAAQDAAGRLTVKSALNPMLWLCGIMIPVLIVAARVFAGSPATIYLATLLIWFVGGIIGVTALVALILAAFHPEKLQSEDFNFGTRP
jgi:hypothetical protein